MEFRKGDSSGLSSRIINMLRFEEIYTIEELTECLQLKNPRFPLGLPLLKYSVGSKSIEAIEKCVGYKVDVREYTIPWHICDRKRTDYCDYEEKDNFRIMRKAACN